jgi:hypothetical protein
MRRTAIAVCFAAALLASTASSAVGATLSPTNAFFGNEAVGEVTKPKIFKVTAEPADAVLPLTIATTGDFSQTSNCPSTLGFLTTSSCEINVIFAPKASGARTGTLSTTTLVLGGPSAALAGTGTRAGSPLNAGKCKKKGKGKAKARKKAAKKGAVAAKKKAKKGKKCKSKKAKKGKGKKK